MTQKVKLQLRLVGDTVNGEELGDGRKVKLLTITQDREGMNRLVRTATWASHNGAYCELTLQR